MPFYFTRTDIDSAPQCSPKRIHQQVIHIRATIVKQPAQLDDQRNRKAGQRCPFDIRRLSACTTKKHARGHKEQRPPSSKTASTS